MDSDEFTLQKNEVISEGVEVTLLNVMGLNPAGYIHDVYVLSSHSFQSQTV